MVLNYQLNPLIVSELNSAIAPVQKHRIFNFGSMKGRLE